MIGQPSVNKSKTPEIFSYIWAGVKLGLKTGLGLSTIYAFLSLFIIEISGNGLGLGLFYSILATQVIFLFGILPATFLGTFTGTILGLLIGILKDRISQLSSVAIGILTCIVLATLFHIIFGIKVVLSFQPPPYSSMSVYETYPFLFGIPAIIYVFAGGCVSWYIYARISL
jgi:hypothetical protein